ncbi:hypothetical protein [Azospirillum thermophilum]|uniref:Uncharacterized protein n=1 Tax=Azospirillum thermophilum TaxID=2202148 RepID=A0A2S2CXB4_9PROT|nr:hypothetical protein [Azospirillum thermophilum]AWK89164.1 hypothetical protein DEW08_24570 [Azospirillum thermophilum]
MGLERHAFLASATPVILAAGLLLSGCAVRTVDCWQLDEHDLEEARGRGQCNDAFARNREELVPVDKLDRPARRKAPVVTDAPAPPGPPPEPRRKPRLKTSAASVVAEQVQALR